MKRIVKIFDIILAVCCAVVLSFVAVGEYTLPDNIVSYGDDDTQLSSIFSYSGDLKTQSVDYQNSSTTQQTIKLLNIIPVKNVTVANKELQEVYVSGEAFGIKLYTDGVIVVGTQAVDLGNEKVNPAEESGIEVGDIIISINDINVYTSDDVTAILNDNNGNPYKIKIKRDDRYKTFTLTPVYSDREGCYKAGMWVRDSTAGIGTITFYNPQSGIFASLGHQINDVDTNEIMPLLEGEAVSASVTSVQKASNGNTGSLVCDFENYTIGRLCENSYCGVYGAYSSIGENCELYPVASAQQVEKGSAKIISTTDSCVPKSYDIEITHINYSSDGTKDIVFKVTDEELIEETGGIVQGMSGSPIIQNGKLVGAVTHVIINDPQKGYAIFAQTMLEKSNAVE